MLGYTVSETYKAKRETKMYAWRTEIANSKKNKRYKTKYKGTIRESERRVK